MRRIEFAETDSTNAQARRLAAEYPGEPLLVAATVQTAGRGREGREWRSPPGGAWLSVVWPLAPIYKPGEPAIAPLAAAVAMRRAILDVAPELDERLAVKWPNDLLIDQCKVGGILCEQLALPPLSTGDESSRVLIVGVGVNVANDPAELGDNLRRPATSLAAATGRAPSVEEFIHAAEHRLGEALAWLDAGRGGEIVRELRKHLAFLGEVKSFAVGDQTCAGVVEGIDDDGRLLLHGEREHWQLAVGEMAES